MRRLNLRREEGVAMTEFALIAPVFLLIVVGLLLFGRLFFYWIETNHLASETARWAAVDRNPYAPAQTLQQGARFGGQTDEFKNGTRVCIDFPNPDAPGTTQPEASVEQGDPVRVRVVNTFEIFGAWKLSIRGSSTMRIERIAPPPIGSSTTEPQNYDEGADPVGVCT